MKAGELLRVRVAFGALGAVPVFLAGWLGWLQVGQAGTLPRDGRSPLPLVAKTADAQGWRVERLPAPRGTIVDRHGATLAADCEQYEVRARIALPYDDAARCRAWLAALIDDLALALVADPERPDRVERRERHRERLAKLFRRELRTDSWPADGALPKGSPRVADVLVAGDVQSLAATEALRRLPELRTYRSVSLHFLHSFRRVYPERELTFGIVGHCDSVWQDGDAGSDPQLRRYGVCGLESFAALEPGEAATRRYLADGRQRPYFVAPVDNQPTDTVLHATLDLELQRAAVRALTEQAEAGTRNDESARPLWGALVLLEIATGDVLAAASWHRDVKNPQAASFTPYQSLFEPGSIVKPLVLAYALEVGALDWSHVFDCSPGGADYRERIAGLGRKKPVRDDHLCGSLTPHGIIVNSSNIGAAFVGLMLERGQWQDYMRGYGFDSTLALRLPHEVVGGTNRDSFLPSVSQRSFRANSAISFSFGYELTANALQVARAYLRLFRGLGAELRLCRGLEIDGVFHPVPLPQDTGPRLRPEVVDLVRLAMVDVVSDDPHATGHHLHRDMLRETGIDLHGLVGGKTGTAVSTVGQRGGGSLSVRNASFVGFLPADEPRWLAVCVLQKDGSARFYGGSYAAPPAVRLLLQCQQLAERRQLHQGASGGSGGQTRVGSTTPGSSGWEPSADVGGLQGYSSGR